MLPGVTKVAHRVFDVLADHGEARESAGEVCDADRELVPGGRCAVSVLLLDEAVGFTEVDRAQGNALRAVIAEAPAVGPRWAPTSPAQGW